MDIRLHRFPSGSRTESCTSPAPSRPFKSRPAWAGVVVLTCLMAASPRAHATDCFDTAAAYQHVNPMVLRAIAWQESHNRADARNVNTNGSVDYGVMQINTVHLSMLSRYGIGREELMSPCKNIYVAAWQLRRMILKYGNTWTAVGSYHSATPALRDKYLRRIQNILRRWGLLRVQGRMEEVTAPRASASIVD